MPEMPEVEMVRRMIEPQVQGKIIQAVLICHPQIIAYPDQETWIQQLTGQKIISMSRRGKFLTFHFENKDRMVLHLRMTGQLLVTSEDFPQEKHTHLIANLSDGKQIRYVDVRRFGRFWYLKAGETDHVTGQDKLGIEPFDSSLTSDYLQCKLGKRKTSIKLMLLDQTIVAGIGNIYSDEILHAAGIYPDEKCIHLKADDWRILADKIPEIMAWGVAANDMTPAQYLAGKGKKYSDISDMRVYGRAGQPCRHCNTVIQRIVIGGRSSCYCPNCQKKR